MHPFSHESSYPEGPFLDLRKTKCPLNFVKARLALEKLPQEALLTLWLDKAHEATHTIVQSLTQEGYVIHQTLTPHRDLPDILVLQVGHKRL